MFSVGLIKKSFAQRAAHCRNHLLRVWTKSACLQRPASAATTPVDAQAKSDAEAFKKSGEWADSLKLNDPAKAARVREVIATHLKTIRDWHNEHPFTTVAGALTPSPANR